MLSIQRRGAEFALVKLADHFGSSLPSKLPKLWEAIVGPLQQINNGNSFGKLVYMFLKRPSQTGIGALNCD